ncbi:MAG TPA: biotin-independent malonate decarboxylase subunit gamma [Burkholderiales bacterium]|nr:biotin-independent malonate decarboxylase subunit gamma [Burkholderiales bacterium]
MRTLRVPISLATAEDSYSGNSALRRIEGLLDPGSFVPASVGAGSLYAGSGMLGGKPVVIAATDREIAGGSLGVAESHALAELIKQDQAAKLPFILCLDSAGARLDEGLPALGAFRQLYRQVLDLRLAGVPMLALLGRDCFGGASMMAATCGQRVYAIGSRLAMSGPAVIQALGGRNELDASDGQAVNALMGGTARAAMESAGRLNEDTIYAFRQAALDWLVRPGMPPDLREQHNRLGARLLKHDMAPSPTSSRPALPDTLLELVPPTFEAREADGVMTGRILPTAPNSYFGFIGGAPVGALAAWTLAGECLQFADTHPGDTLTLLLDSPGQAPTFRDERIMLSEYVAHLAMVLSSLRNSGHRLTLQVLGDAAGGIYVALAAPAVRVVALPGATVQVLPPAAIARVLRRQGPQSSLEDYLQSGVIDTLV